jgi:hypothetical protein
MAWALLYDPKQAKNGIDGTAKVYYSDNKQNCIDMIPKLCDFFKIELRPVGNPIKNAWVDINNKPFARLAWINLGKVKLK